MLMNIRATDQKNQHNHVNNRRNILGSAGCIVITVCHE
jgi:hypothetical protein